MPTLRRPTFTLSWEDTGPRGAKAVVLMPSLLCDHTMFAHLAARLSDRYRVLGVDLRGHGKSTSPRRRYSLEDQANDLAALLDAADVPDAALVGISWGAMIAMRAAVYHPKRVLALALLDASAEPDALSVRLEYLAMAASVRVLGVTEAIARRVEPIMFSEGFRRRHPETVRENVETWMALDPLGAVRATEAVVLRTDVRPLLGDVAVPTLVLVGSEDRAQPPEKSRAIADAIPGARYVVVPGAGHLSAIEQPAETTRLVSAFLDEHLLRAS